MMKGLILTALLSFVVPEVNALANPACNEDWGDLDTVELDASDLATHSKAPGAGEAFGKATCLSGGEENLIAFRWKVERALKNTIEKNYATHAKYGQSDADDYICHFEDSRGLDSAMGFDKPEGDTELHKSYAKKTCSGKGKRFAFAEVRLLESYVKLRCGSKEKMQEWDRQCGGREPSSVKAVKSVVKKAPGKRK
ncbi:MAG: hypothetical protein EOP11_26490 [Proteobacteria bacterium]|nr:MAG: hypothetical protein EOP11_26490 [Pseudomonadota bacterium]